MNAKNKIVFLDERIVGDYKVCYITFDFEKHINVFFFFILSSTNELLLCMPDIVEDLG